VYQRKGRKPKPLKKGLSTQKRGVGEQPQARLGASVRKKITVPLPHNMLSMFYGKNFTDPCQGVGGGWVRQTPPNPTLPFRCLATRMTEVLSHIYSLAMYSCSDRKAISRTRPRRPHDSYIFRILSTRRVQWDQLVFSTYPQVIQVTSGHPTFGARRVGKALGDSSGALAAFRRVALAI